MPRDKSFRRSQAARRRMAERRLVVFGPQRPSTGTCAREGTGFRHKVKQWPISALTGRSHKLVIPPEDPDKKFVLVIGASHLRAMVDGFVKMPEGRLSFGFMSTPGACASELRAELLHAAVPRTPDAVCVMAPSNNLTASRTVDEAGADFRQFLRSVCNLWTTVFVQDFTPRLNADMGLQELMRQEFHRVAASMGIRYFPTAEHFPLDRLDLWSRDGVHLSDAGGMAILSQLIWMSAYQQLETPPPTPQVPLRTSPPVRTFVPKVVVKGEAPVPRLSNPFDWTVVSKGRKADETPVKCFIPLNPVRFSSAVLDVMDKAVPSHLPSPVCTAVPQGKSMPNVVRWQKAVASKRKRGQQQVEAKPGTQLVSREASPGCPVTDALLVEVEATPCFVEVSSQDSPTSVKQVVAGEEVEATPCVVEVFSQDSPTSPLQVVVIEEEEATPCVVEVSSQDAPTSHIQVVGMEEMPDKESLHLQHSSGCGKMQSQANPSSSILWSSVVAGTSIHVQHSVTGSFHQGSNLFKYAGLQCMAVSLVSLAKHAVDSVFAWQAKDLDRVVVLGDRLYTSLRDNNKISGSSKLLCVPDLPKHSVIDGHNFEFQYGDYVSGDVTVVNGEFIQAAIFMSLQNGLKNMFAKYDTCLLTLCGTTCAVISQNGRYAVVDSHARSAAGMADPNGNSVVVYFSCLKEVYSFIYNLSTSLTEGDRPYEIAGVRVICGGRKSELRTMKCTDTVKTSETASMAFSSSLVCGIPSGTKVERGMKRKITGQTCASKKMKRNNVSVVNSDVVFISNVTSKKLWFDPICEDVAQALCTQFNVEFEKHDAPMPTAVGLLGTPCKNDKIVADGNCFFRAISQAVSGTQKNHRKIRLAVVKQLESNVADYKGILRSEYTSVVEYIKSSKMRYVGSWATEVEIQAAADCLGVNIFTYHDDRWLEYSCKYRCFSKQGIYLENCNGNHYESVVCVHQPQLHSCYGSCKLNRSDSKVYNVRRQSAEKSSWASSEAKRMRTVECTSGLSPVVISSGNRVVSIENDVTDCDVDEVNKVTLKFSPLCTEVAKTLCSKCNVESERQDVQVHTEYGSLGVVCKTNKIVEDGNSFFRAISDVICGSQKVI
ncbi:uncharacterized protein LOC121902129 isoform X1 [Thunnus maccoyii]|uniref:uncharacterized protein LOC121902129 isoform X1 n=1 Tax=Thunnus maccoyii TaxID=8240 RepID=UPI001C4B561C|nr:uncharacterized protein LOC121902129 isoform X1 [Thunnus maccoyii]